jgi:hypothetical protein
MRWLALPRPPPGKIDVVGPENVCPLTYFRARIAFVGSTDRLVMGNSKPRLCAGACFIDRRAVGRDLGSDSLDLPRSVMRDIHCGIAAGAG